MKATILKQTIAPMTLGNMHTNGVRALAAYCLGCGCDLVLDVSAYADDVPPPF